MHPGSLVLWFSNETLEFSRISTGLRPPPSKPVAEQSPGLKLPDASFLLNTPVVPSQLNAMDHSSRVAAAMAESAARKRDLSGPAASYPRSKVPKGAVPSSKRVPETGGGHLLPPQLSGRYVKFSRLFFTALVILAA